MKVGGINVYLSLSDIPLSDRIISRFDIIFPIREFSRREEYLDYGNFVLDRNTENISIDSELLMKYIEYAHRIKTATFDSDAKKRINEYAADCAINKDLAYITSKRVIHTIHRICGAFARLHLSSNIDINMVESTIEIINQIIGTMNLNKAKLPSTSK